MKVRTVTIRVKSPRPPCRTVHRFQVEQRDTDWRTPQELAEHRCPFTDPLNLDVTATEWRNA